MRCSYSPFLSKAVVVSNNVLPVLQAADNTKNSANALGELRPNGGTRVTKGNLRSAQGDNARAATSEVLHHPHVGTHTPFIKSQVAAVRGRHDRRGFVPGG